MTSHHLIYHLILIHLISYVHSRSSPRDIIGTSACETYGVQQKFCGFPDAPVESFPNECSSFIYEGVDVINNTLTDRRLKYYSEEGYLDKLIATNKNVLITYGYPSVKEWCAIIQPDNTAGRTKAMNDLKAFLDQHKGIKGFLLTGVLEQYDPPSACPDLNQNLKCYIEEMKTTFPDQIVGISIPASQEIDYYQNSEIPWLDFCVLDPSADFYALSLYGINKCAEEFLQTGQYPLNGNYDYTVDKTKKLVEQAGANLSKLYYTISAFAENLDENAYFCLSYVASYCTNSTDASTSMCGDTLQSYYAMGAYIKQNGAGFIFGYIDTDDFDCTCQCGQSYPAFNAVLNGFKGGPPPPPCPLFDRTC